MTVRAWNPHLIPGLLQTTRYAAGAISTARPAYPPGEVRRYAHQRATRVDQFLTRWQQHPGEAVFVIGEQALRLPLTHPGAHRTQLQQLLNVADLPGIRLHVMPDRQPVPGRVGQMSLYALEGGVRVGYLETPVGGWYSTRPADVARLHTSFAEVAEAALNPADTRTLIQEVLTP